MKKALLIGLLFAFTAQAETVVERVDFRANDKGAQVMVSFDLLSMFDLVKGPNPYDHWVFKDTGYNLCQTEPDAETIAMILEKYGDGAEEEGHWSTHAGKYKLAAVVAAIGAGVAYIVSESKESSGRDISVASGRDTNINTGQSGSQGTEGGEGPSFEGLE